MNLYVKNISYYCDYMLWVVLYINPFIKKTNEILDLFNSDKEFVYTDTFIFVKHTNASIISNFLSYIEENLLLSVYSDWEKYIKQYNKTKTIFNKFLSFT